MHCEEMELFIQHYSLLSEYLKPITYNLLPKQGMRQWGTRDNINKEDILNPKCQWEKEGVQKNSDEPLACIHARIDHLFFKMFPHSWH